MAEQRPFGKKCRYMAEAVLAYVFYGACRILPASWASAVTGKLLRLIGPHMGISHVAYKNLDLAFPEKTQEEKKRIVEGMWENLGRVLAEYPHLRRMQKHIEIIGREYVERARDSGKSAILFSGHLANWEINAIGSQSVGLPLHFIYRKPNNPYVDGLLRHARAVEAPERYIEKGAAGARAMRSVFKNNGVLALLIDQKLNEGVAVPFFGHDAMTAPAVAHFALRFGLPVYPCRVERTGGMRFRVTVYPPLAVQSTGDIEADTRNVLTDMNRMLEDWIRARPEQWLWIHKRWPQSSQ
jgi:Kdo2-lipid IVA lauroyltransferase/acyltransferase